MKEKNPFDKVFDQIADLLAKTKVDKSKPLEGKFDKGVEKQLDEIEKNIEFLRKVTEEALEKSGIDSETLKGSIENPPDSFSRKEKRILERSKKLKGEADKVEREYAKKAEFAKIQKKKAKSTGKKRKRKIKKKLGGEGWLRL